MEIIKYDNSYINVWDNFVNESKNGTIFHSRKFLNYHSFDKFEDKSLLFKNKNRIVSVFSAALIKTNEGERILKSHPGTSYGGPLFNKKDGDLGAVIDVIDEILNYASDGGFDSLEMRLSPRVFHKYPSEELEYVLWHRGFKVINTELSSAVQLMFETKDSLYSKFKYNTKQPVRKAVEAGVIFRETDDYVEFWKMLELNLIKHNAGPTHSLEEINKLKELIPDNIKLFGSYYENKLIAGTLVFICNNVACHTFYIAQDYNYQQLRPLNLLLIETINWARDNNFRYLNFGISTEAGGTIINPSLFRFKEGFAATGTVRRYYKKGLLDDEI